MPKPANDSRPPLAEMLSAFDPSQVAALAQALSFIADTCDHLGERDIAAIGTLQATSYQLTKLKALMEKYR